MIWQLVGGNNRVLGVSPGDFGDLAAAVEAAERVRERIAEGTPELMLGAPARWRWSVTGPDGEPLAVAGRSYERRVDCATAVRRFIDTATHADTDPVLGRRGRFWNAATERSPGPRPPASPAESPPGPACQASDGAGTGEPGIRSR